MATGDESAGLLHSQNSSRPELSLVRRLVIVGIPAFVFMCSFLFQNMCLHIATHYYVQWMFRLRANVIGQSNTEETASNEVLSTALRQGSLHDVTASWMGYHDIPMVYMDILSASVPLCFTIVACYKKDMHVWSKVMMCGAFLAVGKGMLAFMTVVPDSTGWDHCKERLGGAGVEYFKNDENMNFGRNFASAVKDLFYLELVGAIKGGSSRHLRFCGDMMYSGHTYFVTLFSLGLYDLTVKSTTTMPSLRRRCLRSFIGSALSFFVGLDVLLILMNRFHYSMDCYVAVLVTMLFYTNGMVAIVVDWWAEDAHEETDSCNNCGECKRKIVHDYHDGEFLLPPCCIPACFCDGRYFIHHYPPKDAKAIE